MSNTVATPGRKVTLDLESGDPVTLSRLSRAVRSVHGTTDPDLEQEVFIRTLRAFRRDPQVRFPNALMWKIVRSTVADYWRHELRTRTEDIEVVAERHLALRPDLDERIDRDRNVERLHDGLFGLGCDTRGPMYLYYVEEYSIGKIAHLSGRSVSAIKMALCRGRQQLARECRIRISGDPATNKSRYRRIPPPTPR